MKSILKMNNQDICFMSACELREKIKTQEISSQEITEIIIERIEKINPIINAYCTPTFDLAREMAKKADKAVKNGEELGLLQGIPTSIKDETVTKGIRTTFGCKLLENYIPKYDEVAVKRLKDAGIVLLGKTNTPALGFKAVTDNLIFGATKNPWDLEKTSGGSSGGAAAAITSGLSTLAIGSDGGGSIRIPSALCGVFGFKPNFGRIPQITMRANPSLGTLYHKGPIVRYVKDAALMLDVMAGEHDSDRYSLPKPNYSYLEKIEERPTKLKIGFTLNLGNAKLLDSEIEKNFLEAVQIFKKIDWITEEAKIDIKKAEPTMTISWTTGFAYSLKPYLKQWEDKLDSDLVDGIKMGLGYSTEDIKRAEVQREEIYHEISRFFRDYDILLTPTVASLAFEIGKMFPDEINGQKIEDKKINMGIWIPYTYPFNLTGHPAASIPCGWSSDGLPIGMQIIGKRLDELTVLQVSKAFEEITPWQDKKPIFN